MNGHAILVKKKFHYLSCKQIGTILRIFLIPVRTVIAKKIAIADAGKDVEGKDQHEK